MKNERGFIIFEVIVLSIILVGASASVYALRSVIRSEGVVMARSAALYLAEEEMAHIMERRDKNELIAGRFDFLGKHDLKLNDIDYDVFADVAQVGYDDNAFRVKVTVRWKIFQKERELNLERFMKKHSL